MTWQRLLRIAALATIMTIVASPAEAQPATALAGNVGDVCARTMVRKTFDYRPPQVRSDDPRVRLPQPMSTAQRRALHAVLWPSDASGRLTVREWLRARNFACLESGFADLEAVHARYNDGTSKVVSFLSGAKALVDDLHGMTAKEIDALVTDWRARFPGSLLVRMMEVRLLEAAAWQARGPGSTNTVTDEGWRTFGAFNRAALRKVQAFPRALDDHVLVRYVALRAISDTDRQGALSDLSLAALKRDPLEINLAVYAGTRMVANWGGSEAIFENDAQAARRVVGPTLQDRAYTRLYTFVVGLDDWPAFHLANLEWIRAGLLDFVRDGESDDIVRLQRFACRTRDVEALDAARHAWSAYAARPQLSPPATTLDASCRDWSESLPAS